nr:hypothetical protein [Tanacetum cinerariifolium]
TSSDSPSDDLSNSLFDHSLPAPSSGMRPSHHLCSLVPSIPRSSAAIPDRPSHDSSFVSPSRKRSRYPAAFVPLSSRISGALSYARADLLPSPKRVKSSEFATDLEDSSTERFKLSRSKETDLDMDIDVVRSDGIDIDPRIQAKIDKCISYADALRDRGIDARVVVEAVDQDEIETGARGLVEVRVDRVTHPVIADDIPKPAQEEGAIEVTYETLVNLVQRFHDYIVEIPVHHVQAIEDIQRESGTQDRSDRTSETMPKTRSGASRTREGGDGDGENGNGGNENEGNGNGGNENGENRNGNGNEGGNRYNFRGFMPTRECTYQDFMKCQPLNFNGTKGVVRLTHWFEKMETVFHISNCLDKYQVKYVTCTLLNSALTWWNSHKRTIGIEAAYAMSWAELMKLMTEVYCLRNEELVVLCTRMVPNEEDKVERFVGGLPDNIQGNVIAAEPTKLQDANRIANNLMDQTLKGYARSA